MSSFSNISKLKVPELKKELKKLGLSVAGNKNELVERLSSASKSSISSGSSIDLNLIRNDSLENFMLEDVLLQEDEDDHQNSSESIPESEIVLEESPQNISDKGVEKKTKIVLTDDKPLHEIENNKRRISETISDEPQRKLIKISGVSAKERLELRAKKFGVKLDDNNTLKLSARAERFGCSENEPKLSATDKMKKRAERFGNITVTKDDDSSEMRKKLEARKNRFSTRN